MSWVGCSSNASVSSFWRPTRGSIPRAGRVPRTTSATSRSTSRCSGSSRPCSFAAAPGNAERLASSANRARTCCSPTAPSTTSRVDVFYGPDELLDAIRRLPEIRFRLPSVLSLGAVPADSGGAGALDARRRRHARSWRACSCPRPRGITRWRSCARTTSSCSPARPRWARPRSPGCSGWRCSPRAGRCTSARGRSRCSRAWTATARSCSSPTTRSAPPSTGRTRPSAGRPTSTASCAPPTTATGSSGPRAPRRCAPGCGGCTASAAPSASRSRAPCRSTRPSSGPRRRR